MAAPIAASARTFFAAVALAAALAGLPAAQADTALSRAALRAAVRQSTGRIPFTAPQEEGKDEEEPAAPRGLGKIIVVGPQPRASDAAPQQSQMQQQQEQQQMISGSQSESVMTQDANGNVVTRTTQCKDGRCTVVTRTGSAPPGSLVPKMPRMAFPRMAPLHFGFPRGFGSSSLSAGSESQEGKQGSTRRTFFGDDAFGWPRFKMNFPKFPKMAFPKGSTEHSSESTSSESKTVNSQSWVKDGKVYEKTETCINGKCETHTSVRPLHSHGDKADGNETI